MTTVSNSFTATGAGPSLQLTNPLSVTPIQNPVQSTSLAYALSGTFVGTLALQFSTDGQTGWTTLVSYTTTQSSTSVFNPGYYRWNCTAYTSGTAVTTLDNGYTTRYEVDASTGAALIKATDAGVAIQGDITGAVTVVAGQIGEVSTGSGSAVAAGATTVTGNVTSISLTPGHWLIHGSVTVAQGATGLTTGSPVTVSIVTTTASDGTLGTTMSETSALLKASGFHFQPAPTISVAVTATTTYYLTANITYAAGSPTFSGSLVAVRRR